MRVLTARRKAGKRNEILAKEIELEDHYENMGAQLVKE